MEERFALPAGGRPPAIGAALVVVMAALALGHRTGLPMEVGAPVVTLAAFAALAAFARSGERHFGWANTVTLLRLTLGALLLAAVAAVPFGDRAAWLLFTIAGAAVLLDGVDGWLARQLGEASAFGARFDMETDTLILIACTALLAVAGTTGAWVLLAGALRPGFALARRAVPWMRGPLPPSLRRKVACAAALAMLVACLLPAAAPIAPVTAAAALAVLVGSFAIDVAWLRRRATA